MSKIIDIFTRSIFIKPHLNLLQWAEKYRILSKESSSNFGKFKAISYQKEPMIEISNPKREKIVLLWASQLGKSELLNNVLGYYIHQEPSTILFMLPNKDDAEDYSKRRLAPMFRDCAELNALINANDASNTILIKNFRGGNLALVGSNSPSKLASKPIKILLVDEADRCEATKEGDSIELAQKRTSTFYDRKIIICSTPTIAGSSTIQSEFQASDQRYFYIKCPFCNHSQKMIFERIIFELDEYNELIEESVKYQCSECGTLLNEQEKNEAVANGEWIPANPKSNVAGFFLNAIYSPFFKMHEMARAFLNSKDSQLKLQTFKNTLEATTYEPPNVAFSENELLERIEEYSDENLPAKISFITAGVDIQSNRIEIIFIGWCKGYEAYNIDYKQIYGNTDQDEVWQKSYKELMRKFRREDGKILSTTLALIDSGYNALRVYNFVSLSPRFIASKGMSETSKKFDFINNVKKIRNGVRLVNIGTFKGKSEFFRLLHIKTAGEGYFHYNKNFTNEFFLQLTAEKLQKTKNKNGYDRLSWVKIRDRNEALDITVLALGAAKIIKNQIKRKRVVINENGARK
ncbi:MAG: phage terminase large subunit family protein [Campylobacter sp.]